MKLIDVVIPLVGGLVAVFMPQVLIKKSLPAEEFNKKAKFIKKVGFVLIGIATIYLVLTLAATNQANAQTSLPPGLKMHKTQAGKLGPDGWTDARSTEGRFSIRLPILYNDLTVTESDPKADVKLGHTVGGKTADGFKVSATRIIYRAKGLASKNFEKFSKSAPNTKRLTYKGYEAVEFELSNSTSFSRQRAVLIGDEEIVLILEAPKTLQSALNEIAPRIFDSLNVDK